MNPHSFSFMDPKNKIKITEKVEGKFVLVIIKKRKVGPCFSLLFFNCFFQLHQALRKVIFTTVFQLDPDPDH